MTEFGSSLLAFIVAISVLVAVHEFGHFWVAKKLGIKVLRFSIGFGKPLWIKCFGADRTEFVIAALPLGGYVKMLDEREAPVAAEEVSRSFNRQSLATRSAVILAGPLFNFLFAIVAYWLMFVSGVPGLKPMVGVVAPHSTAAVAGFQEGDLIESIAGQTTPTWDTATLLLLDAALAGKPAELRVRQPDESQRLLVIDFSEIDDALDKGGMLNNLGLSVWRPSVPAVIDRLIADAPDQRLQVEIERDGIPISLELVPRSVEDHGETIGQIGAYVRQPADMREVMRTEVRYGPLESMGKSMDKTWEMTALTLRTLWGMVSGKASLENISGPISIAQYAGYSASIGLASFLKFLAIVSISLGVLNLLPVPVLDGGHLLFNIIEWIQGKPLSEHAQQIGQQLGIFALLALMSIAFYNDLSRLFGA
jgi:regulator of sigma E protease